MSTEMDDDSSPVRRRVSCTKYFDALWFCYSPYYQMQQYYRVGKLDDCTKKFSALFDCLSLKTKSASEAQKILEEHEKADAAKHIWIMRTEEEASRHWNETFGHLDDPTC
ncbi:hypothetical protein HA466_0233630 [Hirschfeldia incana]|nr:hypothetical protein HA466_0233630 [Hirschfeldia incana]